MVHKHLLRTTPFFLAVIILCPRSTLGVAASSIGGIHHPANVVEYSRVRGGGGWRSPTKNNDSRRWDALMTHCVGSWSGTIGWYDCEVKDNDNDKDGKQPYQLIPRSDNNQRNMRLSFQPREDDPEVADWIVYHARDQGVREEVVLRKLRDRSGNHGVPNQTFYCFSNGNLGRSGTNFMELPVIEHGFWDVSSAAAVRKTVVLVYNPRSGHLSKICYLQQEKKVGRAANNFDVSGVDKRDIGIMPKKAKLSLKEIKRKWFHSPKSKDSELLAVQTSQYTKEEGASGDDASGALLYLLGPKDGTDDGVLRVSLPNGVILACPLSIKSDDGTELKSFDIAMVCRKKDCVAQVVEFAFHKCKLKQVKGSTIGV